MAGSEPSFKDRVGAIILGAGRSQRMGRPKLLLPWNATSVLGHIIAQWQSLEVRQIAVVYAADAHEVEEELDRLRLAAHNRILNPAPERGMFSSIQCAAAWQGWTGELTHWILALGDQPQLRMETLRALLEFGSNHPNNICQPLRHGHRKHPVWLPRQAFAALKNSSASDLKEFLETHPGELAGFESDDEGLELDLDTPEDYERAKRVQNPLR